MWTNQSPRIFCISLTSLRLKPVVRACVFRTLSRLCTPLTYSATYWYPAVYTVLRGIYLPLNEINMKQTLFLFIAALGIPVSSQLVLPLFQDLAHPPSPPSLRSFAPDRAQQPMMDPAGPGPVLPPSDSSPKKPPSAGAPGPGSVMLSDVMGRDRSINIFAGLVRDIESVSQRLDDSTKNTTVLAPLNSAVESLPRKPWEDPRDYDALGANAYEGDDGQERAQRNLRRFVEAHIVPVSPWEAGDKVKSLGDDRSIWWESKDGIKVVWPTLTYPMTILNLLLSLPDPTGEYRSCQCL